MKNKKSYIAPTSDVFTIPTGRLCQVVNISVSGGKVDDPGNIGFSKEFLGVVEDDTPAFPWEEE